MTWTDRKVRESKLIRARGRDEACARLIRAHQDTSMRLNEAPAYPRGPNVRT